MMKRFEYYAALGAVIFFFCWALSAQYKVDRLGKKVAKLKADNSILVAEKSTIKNSIELQNSVIKTLADITKTTQVMLSDEAKKAKEFEVKTDKKIDDVRRQPSTNGNCELIRQRMIKNAHES